MEPSTSGRKNPLSVDSVKGNFRTEGWESGTRLPLRGWGSMGLVTTKRSTPLVGKEKEVPRVKRGKGTLLGEFLKSNLLFRLFLGQEPNKNKIEVVFPRVLFFHSNGGVPPQPFYSCFVFNFRVVL